MHALSSHVCVATLCAGFLGAATNAHAASKHATVHKRVNLREQPTTSSSTKRLLAPGEPLDLLSSETSGGFHSVKTSVGEQGFVWSPNIKVRLHPPGARPAGNASDLTCRRRGKHGFTAMGEAGPCRRGFWNLRFGGTPTSGNPKSDQRTNERKNRIEMTLSMSICPLFLSDSDPAE